MGEMKAMDNDEDNDVETVVVCLLPVCFVSRLILSCINRFEKKRDISKSLADEWSRSTKLKHQREDEERRFLRCVWMEDHPEPPSAST